MISVRRRGCCLVGWLVAVIKPIIVTLIDMTLFIINKLFRVSLFQCLLNMCAKEQGGGASIRVLLNSIIQHTPRPHTITS